uniref:DDE_3 domain-containing protein n=1 Tax=Caenorhabditis japonica TaxID=281687 RepID=A0A8R1HYZ1_CAEJA
MSIVGGFSSNMVCDLNSHAKLLSELLDSLMSDLNQPAKIVLAKCQDVGAAHVNMNEKCCGMVFDQLGETFTELITKVECVRSKREAVKSWMCVVSYVVDSIKSGYMEEWAKKKRSNNHQVQNSYQQAHGGSSMVRPFGKKNFTVDVRKSIVRGHELGAHPNILATQFDCSSSQIYRILKNNRNDHLSWGPREWANHIWSDESNFNLFGTDGIQWIRRPIGSRYAPQYQSPTVKHEGGSVMVWGCFSDTSMGPLKRIVGTMERYVYEDILENTMRPWARANLGRLWVFQQDNDPKHTSGHVANWLRRRRVDLLEWPSQSPDLNPIEHMWEERKRRLKVVRASNANQKFAQLEAAWKSIPMTVVQTLLDSMPRRCQAVIDAKAYPTKY